MARRLGTYSRMVAWLKILLPLLAVAVLGTVFLINTDNGFESGFTFTKADRETLEAGSFLSHPQIDGMTNKGEPYHLTAEKIAPLRDDPNLVEVTSLSGDFRFLAGDKVTLAAESALFDIRAQTITLQTGGRIETSDGNIAEIKTLVVQIETGEMSGTGIEANGPLWQFSTDQFGIEANDTENHVLWFENNVKVVYALEQEGE